LRPFVADIYMDYLFFPKSFNGLSTHMLILHHTCIFRWLASRKRPSYTVEFDETGNPDDYEFYACLHEKSDGSSEDDSDVPSQDDVSPCALRFHSIYIFVFCTLGCELVEIFLLIYIFSFHARVKP